MNKFKAGEVAIGQNFKESAHLNGEDLEIIKGYGSYRIDRINDTPCETHNEKGYVIRLPNGEASHVEEKNLRKKKPPQETSTWEAVQEIVGWNPSKIADVVKRIKTEKV